MGNLFVFGFDDVAAAERARDRILGLQSRQLIELDDIVAVENQGGKVKLHQAQSTTAAGAAGGAMWGGLIGLLFFMPLLGMAVGAGAGALSGKAVDIGVDDNFMKELGRKLQPGNAAVFVMVRRSTKDKVIDELADLEGWLIQTSLSSEDEQELKQAFAAARAART
jgi:uncharacterized membrane protein